MLAPASLLDAMKADMQNATFRVLHHCVVDRDLEHNPGPMCSVLVENTVLNLCAKVSEQNL